MSNNSKFGDISIDGPRVSWKRSDDHGERSTSSERSSSLLGKVAVGALALGSFVYGCSDSLDWQASGGQQGVDETKKVLTADDRLEGHRLEGLRARYAGRETGTVFDSDSSGSFESELDEAWQEKRRMASNEPAVDRVVDRKVEQYDAESARKMTLDGYLRHLDTAFDDSYNDTEWDDLQENFHLQDDDVEAVKAALGKVSGRSLGAFVMTELFPSDPDPWRFNAKKNEAVLDYSLQNAGVEYMRLQPALFDKYLSFGPFQNSSFVVRNDAEITRAANKMNDVLSVEQRVPGSMQDLQGDDHVDAAYGALTAKLVRLTRETDSTVSKTLQSASGRSMAMLAAGLHHNPSDAWEAVGKWSEKGGRLEPDWFGSTRRYVRQTELNYVELGTETKLQPMSSYFERVRPSPCEDDFAFFDVKGRLEMKSPSYIASRFDQADRVMGEEFEPSGNLNVVDDKCEVLPGGVRDKYFRARWDH